MIILDGKVLSTLPLMAAKLENSPQDPREKTGQKRWQMRVSYVGPESVYEVELQEPLRGFVSKQYTIGLNGHIEFEMHSDPGIAAGAQIRMNAYEPGERVR
jgi:hypothetical protein